ncbi:hypothetical protein JZO72_06680 [Vagococcus fluvialis]|uniref:hypothetical protein n=1 Tax=Vagococcus fluvialis TaxID=2738 RepID=UPI001A8C95A3|nr:hypothetical protein [Vagococcus fluvialis]MBO0479310.1 hypothetical protein [Vagococcus fluvialis]MBO0485168.1 hypothetical protein [Vagococcus fluvialis]
MTRLKVFYMNKRKEGINMVEYDSLKEALKALYELTEIKELPTGKNAVTFEGLQDLYEERVINVIDLLDHSDIYLDEK